VRLRRADPDEPGIRRLRHGRGFRYVDADGERVDDDARRRIQDLVIPPAWSEVWICPDPNCHLQAVGVDDAGRRQYLYHPEYRQRRDEDKHRRVVMLARRLPSFRDTVAEDLEDRGLTKRRVVAAALRMLDHGVFRTGGEEYAAEHGTKGVATLRRDDVRRRDGVLEFFFTAKGGKDRRLTLDDPLLAATIVALKRRRPDGTDRLLTYAGPDGWQEVHAADVNERFKQLVGDDYTVKDLRTWHATVLAAVALANGKAEQAVVKGVAEELGDTPAVARGSYIDPRILEHDDLARLRGLNGANLNDTESRRRAERAVIRLLRDG
jgi:DNA topoisomerase I